MNAGTLAEVTSVSLTEMKMERDHFLMVSLSNYCARLTAESKSPQTWKNSATFKTVAFKQLGLKIQYFIFVSNVNNETAIATEIRCRVIKRYKISI